MANRIVHNVVIVDSAMGNAVNWISTGTASFSHMEMTHVSFWSSDTTGLLEISGANTTNVIVKLANPFDNDTTLGQGIVTRLGDIKIPTVTAGTGFIYLK